jgi:hypothetical protein
MPASSSELTRLALVCAAVLAGLGCGALELSPAAPGEGVARACSDGLDDDGDGRADFPGDPGCESPDDPSELDPLEPRACSDGIDNDRDGRIDFDRNGNGIVDGEDDPGCKSASSDDELNIVLPACGDGVDNDGDGLADFPEDPQCSSRNDPDEGS